MREILHAGLIKPLHNKRLEAEYYAGCMLHGYRYDKNYLDLVMYLAELPLIILQDNIEWNSQIKIIYDLFYVGESTVWDEDFMKGKDKKLKSALEILIPLSMEYYQIFATEFVYSEAYKQMMMYENYEQALGTDNLGFILDNTNGYMFKTDEEKNLEALKKFALIGESILYKLDMVDLKKTYTKVSFKKDLINLRLYVDGLERYLLKEETNIAISLVLGNVLNILVITYPDVSKMLDPYQVDSYVDAFDILSYPTKLYKNLINDKIVNPVLSQAIDGLYPESYQIMLNKLFKSLDSFDLDKQNRLKMYSGAFETDTLLVQQVNNAFMKGPAQNVT
jgi:hypothetical protein